MKKNTIILIGRYDVPVSKVEKLAENKKLKARSQLNLAEKSKAKSSKLL